MPNFFPGVVPDADYDTDIFEREAVWYITGRDACRQVVIDQLQYNDKRIDFGAFLAYLRSKIIES